MEDYGNTASTIPIALKKRMDSGKAENRILLAFWSKLFVGCSCIYNN
jgi:hypothetical protein